VPYTLSIDAMPALEGPAETEPNDTALTADALPLTKAVAGFTGSRLDDPEKLLALRPEAPFSALDVWKVEDVAAGEQVVVAVVPPERGALLIVDEAELEVWRQRRAQSTAARPAPPPPQAQVVKGLPALVVLRPLADGSRRVRIGAGEDCLPGSTYRLGAATSGTNGLAALVDLVRVLESRPAAQRTVIERAQEVLVKSPDLGRLATLRPQP
jgi:hypothetical protein